MRRRAEKNKGKVSPALWPMYITTIAFIVLPLLYIVGISFLEKGDYFGVKNVVTVENYQKIFDPMYLSVLWESLKLAIITTVLTFLIGYPFAYCTAKLPIKWRGMVRMLLMTPFWLNSLIRLNGWIILMKANGVINTVLQSMGLIEEPLQLLYNDGAVIIGMVYALAPFMILAIYNSVEKLDWSLVEAARDLGAGPVKAFFTVTLPLSLPGIIAGCVLVFVPCIGLFYVSDLFGGSKTMLLGSLIRNEMLQARNWPFGAALSMLMLIATIGALQLYKKIAKTDSLQGIM